MRAACLTEEAQRLLDRQSGLYSVYSDAILKFKSSKDASAFANARKKLDGDYRSISNQISQVMTSLCKEQPGVSEKVRVNCTINQHFEAGKALLLKFSFHFSFFSSSRFCLGSTRKMRGLRRRSRIYIIACRPLAGIFFLFSFRRLDGTEPLNYFFVNY